MGDSRSLEIIKEVIFRVQQDEAYFPANVVASAIFTPVLSILPLHVEACQLAEHLCLGPSFTPLHLLFVANLCMNCSVLVPTRPRNVNTWYHERGELPEAQFASPFTNALGISLLGGTLIWHEGCISRCKK